MCQVTRDQLGEARTVLALLGFESTNLTSSSSYEILVYKASNVAYVVATLRKDPKGRYSWDMDLRVDYVNKQSQLVIGNKSAAQVRMMTTDTVGTTAKKYIDAANAYQIS